MSSEDYFWAIMYGLGLIFIGILRVISGEGIYWGVSIPGWTGWPTGAIGIFIVVYCLRDRKRNRGKPAVTDEQVRRAKTEMDQRYLREHGELPKHPDEKDEHAKME